MDAHGYAWNWDVRPQVQVQEVCLVEPVRGWEFGEPHGVVGRGLLRQKESRPKNSKTQGGGTGSRGVWVSLSGEGEYRKNVAMGGSGWTGGSRTGLACA